MNPDMLDSAIFKAESRSTSAQTDAEFPDDPDVAANDAMVLQSIKYTRGQLRILDQLQLPHAEVYDLVGSSKDAWHAIKEMRTRGAPAIAIVAALSLAVELETLATQRTISDVAEEVAVFVQEKLDYLVTSRPTAVNLMDAARKLKMVVQAAAADESASGETVRLAYVEAAEKMLVDDVQDNRAIGRHGADWILRNTTAGRAGQVSVLTHCNTGSLATAGFGTALGIIRTLHAHGALNHAYCTETRPYNQGSRLTAFELVHDKIPATLITDSMAAALLRLKGRVDRIAAIVVGADRVAANGDTANKIGTYSLALAARYHGVKFLVAAPRTTIDLNTLSGDQIVIEERPGVEVTTIKGPLLTDSPMDGNHSQTISIAAKGINVWNPAFDVTPADLIDGIITEIGVMEKDHQGIFRLQGVFDHDMRTNGFSKIGGM